MKRRPRSWMGLGLALAGSIFLGCTHARDALKEKTRGHYTEEVESVLMAADASKVVFIGQRYHYVFECPKVLGKTLRGPFHKAVSGAWSGQGGSVLVDLDGSLAVKLTLSLPAKHAQAPAAIEAGYKLSGDRLVAEAELKGKRYQAGGLKLPVNVRLNQAYSVQFSERSLAGDAALILLSPVAMGADAVLTIGSLPLVFVGSGIMIYADTKEGSR